MPSAQHPGYQGKKSQGGQNAMMLQFISFGNKLECSDRAQIKKT